MKLDIDLAEPASLDIDLSDFATLGLNHPSMLDRFSDDLRQTPEQRRESLCYWLTEQGASEDEILAALAEDACGRFE